MINSRDAEAPLGGEPVSGSSSADRIGLTLVGIGAAAVLVGVINTILRDALGGGDEPPIRVKGGSIDFFLLPKNKNWAKKKDDPRHWHVPNSKRTKDELNLVVVLGGTATDMVKNGFDLRVVHDDGTEFKVISEQKHVQIIRIDHNSTTDLEPDPQDPLCLRYGQGGHIQRIVLDNIPIWTSGSGSTLCELFVLDY